jgi:hypothetical protein
MHPHCTPRRIKRFWSHARKENDCWLWEGMVDRGYGRLRWDEHWFQAHRVAYFIEYGDFDPALKVCHACDVRNCINPAHLFLGTQADNIADMDAKGRRVTVRGEDSGRAKATEETVRLVRVLRDEGLTHEAIGRVVGLAKPTVGNILRGYTWVHVT